MGIKKRNLITGGSGFLGSHLAKRLIKKEEEVICIDNFFTGTKENIKELINHPSFELIRHDVTEPIKIEVDSIWHLACPASPIHYQLNPIKTTKTSYMGTYNMLGLAKRVNAKILLASTSEIYAKNPNPPWSEQDDRVLGPTSIDRWSYSSSKAVCEHMLFALFRSCNLKFLLKV